MSDHAQRFSLSAGTDGSRTRSSGAAAGEQGCSESTRQWRAVLGALQRELQYPEGQHRSVGGSLQTAICALFLTFPQRRNFLAVNSCCYRV